MFMEVQCIEPHARVGTREIRTTRSDSCNRYWREVSGRVKIGPISIILTRASGDSNDIGKLTGSMAAFASFLRAGTEVRVAIERRPHVRVTCLAGFAAHVSGCAVHATSNDGRQE